MKFFHIFLLSLTVSALAVTSERAQAQAIDKVYAKSVVVAGSGIDLLHGITMQLATTTGGLTWTLPATNVNGVFTNDGTGVLSWATTLPSGLTIPSPTISNPTFTGTVTLPASSITHGGANTFLTTANDGSTVAFTGLNTSSDFSGNGVGSSLAIATGAGNDIVAALNNASTSTNLSVPINVSTSGSHTITSGGLLTASNGFTVTSGTVTLPATSVANSALQGSGQITFTSTGSTLSPAGAVALGGSANYDINLTHANTWTGAITELQAGIGTTQTNAYKAVNTTASTALVPVQQSPSYEAGAHVWGNGADSIMAWHITNIPTSATVPTSVLRIDEGNTGAGYKPEFSISNTGTVTVGYANGALGTTGSVALANSGNSNLTTLQAGASAPAMTYVLPTTAPTANQVLQANGATSPVQLSWVNQSGGMANPMTTTGDMVYASNTATPATPARLGIGASGTMLTVSGGIPAWSATPTLGNPGVTPGTLTLASGSAAFSTQLATSVSAPSSTYIYQFPPQANPTSPSISGYVLTAGTPTGTGPYTVPLSWQPAGGGNYILNQTSLQSSANFNISGTGTASTFDAADGTSGSGLTVRGGNGSSTTGGSLSLLAGTTASGTGANVTITASNGAGTNQNGGNITLTPGTATGTGTNGGVGINTSSPKTALDINGDIGWRATTLDCRDTAKSLSNVSTSGLSALYLTDDTNAFTIYSFANGYDGKRLTLYNKSGHDMTLANESSGATAGNKINTLSGEDVTLHGNSSVDLFYDGTASEWIVNAYQGTNGVLGVVGVATSVLRSSSKMYSGNTLINDTDFAFHTGANETWEVDGVLYTTASGSGVGFGAALNTPRTPSGVMISVNGYTITSASQNEVVGISMLTSNNTVIANPPTTTNTGSSLSILVHGIFTTDATTSGTTYFAFNVPTSGTVTLNSVSYLKLTRLK